MNLNILCMPSCKISISGIIGGLYTRTRICKYPLTHFSLFVSTHLHTFHFFCARLLQSAVVVQSKRNG